MDKQATPAWGLIFPHALNIGDRVRLAPRMFKGQGNESIEVTVVEKRQNVFTGRFEVAFFGWQSSALHPGERVPFNGQLTTSVRGRVFDRCRDVQIGRDRVQFCTTQYRDYLMRYPVWARRFAANPNYQFWPEIGWPEVQA